MTIHSDNNVRSVFDAWTAGLTFADRTVYTVYAGHYENEVPASKGGRTEVYGFTGNSDNDELHEFPDYDEARDFADLVKRRGRVDFSTGDWKFITYE